ncbi:hypothetical protein L210DRAFT_3645628 [Boletus edulis BED1]|uniref:Protein-tyrosine-phosphatase n=1 Tax=Boletus edulis BED1 TaxID=1328754 RepID=A0AAD4BUK1_BOLED|nr:hypothetical protein L210DRAFT_3645628 [Boletus edulis BED1]
MAALSSYGVVPPDTRTLQRAGQFPLLPTTQFARMHLEHLTAHPPDSILFPFLHGLDGDNYAQCMFFASPASPDKPVHPAAMIRDSLGRVVRPPRYRGLVWVVCDDNLDAPSSPIPEETEYDTDSDDFSEDDLDIQMNLLDQDAPMDVDPTPSFMHPTTLRISTADSTTNTKTSVPSPSPPLNIINTNPRSTHDRRNSPTSSDASTDASSSSSDSHSRSTSATSLPSPSSPPCPSLPDAPARRLPGPPTNVPIEKPLKKYPILTCTFLPSQLIQPSLPSRTYEFHGWARGSTVALDVNWEFKPAKVPDGISLRNFGIQLPLYTSISDIVVYSPKGPTPAVLRVASRFKMAVEKKRRERLERWVQAGFQLELESHEEQDPHSTPEGFLKYGVYVLDANAEQLERDLPWLVVRKDGECAGDCDRNVPPRTESACYPLSGMTGLTETTDGRLVGELELEAKLAAEQAERLSGSVQSTADSIPSLDWSSDVPPNVNTRIHRCKRANTIDFARRERDEMRDLTRTSEILTVWGSDNRDVQADEASGSTTATYWNPNVGQVFLGNANDVPIWKPLLRRREHVRPSVEPGCATHPTTSLYLDPFADPYISHDPEKPSPFSTHTNDPSCGLGFDICIECHEHAPFPSVAHLRAAEEHIRSMEMEWVELWHRHWDQQGAIPPRPPPHPSAIIHFPFPSSPSPTPAGLNALLPVIRFLERMVMPGALGSLTSSVGSGCSNGVPKTPPKAHTLPSPWPPIPESSESRSGSTTPQRPAPGSTSHEYPINIQKSDLSDTTTTTPPTYRPRPLKVLLYSSDGYTESSVPALCLLMAVKGLTLPEAYLEMQVTNRRSFFVYQSEVAFLKRVEGRLGVANISLRSRYQYGDIQRGASGQAGHFPVPRNSANGHRPHALTINYGSSTPVVPLPAVSTTTKHLRRPRANTLPSFISDHQSWFDDARFDGSFPSRVLPFLYLGNLNHAANVYMLHALGITHVVSVGECALVPPPQTPTSASPPSCPINPICSALPASPGSQGSLWIEEREGRIKVLDIKGVCDDGIDTLEPQLHPICTWIEKARLAGGRVLVHCRVGVSRSATVTIAYVMQHLGLSLVEAYLVVRSRRLSVLIQPNMRLLYNLLGWEVRLARERAGGDEGRLREELGRSLSWPYLAREVHALNEKYLG